MEIEPGWRPHCDLMTGQEIEMVLFGERFAAVILLMAASLAMPGAVQGRTPDSASASGLILRAALTRSDRDFMTEAAQIGHAQLQAARMALSRAGNTATKDFARRMVQDHSRAGDRLRNLAKAKGVTLPSGPSVFHKSKLRVLNAYDGAGFDRQYADEFGVEAHRSAIRRFRRVLDLGTDRDVRAYARQTMPMLEQHLQQAQALHARLLQPGRLPATFHSTRGVNP